MSSCGTTAREILENDVLIFCSGPEPPTAARHDDRRRDEAAAAALPPPQVHETFTKQPVDVARADGAAPAAARAAPLTMRMPIGLSSGRACRLRASANMAVAASAFRDGATKKTAVGDGASSAGGANTKLRGLVARTGDDDDDINVSGSTDAWLLDDAAPGDGDGGGAPPPTRAVGKPPVNRRMMSASSLEEAAYVETRASRLLLCHSFLHGFGVAFPPVSPLLFARLPPPLFFSPPSGHAQCRPPDRRRTRTQMTVCSARRAPARYVAAIERASYVERVPLSFLSLPFVSPAPASVFSSFSLPPPSEFWVVCPPRRRAPDGRDEWAVVNERPCAPRGVSTRAPPRAGRAVTERRPPPCAWVRRARPAPPRHHRNQIMTIIYNE